MVSGRIYVTNDQIVCGSREGTANVLYPQNSYIHPAEKQCNYTYTHPTTKQCNYSYTHPSTKQCNWTPDGVINWILADTKSVTDTIDRLSSAKGVNTSVGMPFQYPSDADLYKLVINSWNAQCNGRTGSGEITSCELSACYGVDSSSSMSAAYYEIGRNLVDFDSDGTSDPTVYKFNGSNISFVVFPGYGRGFGVYERVGAGVKMVMNLNASLYYAKL